MIKIITFKRNELKHFVTAKLPSYFSNVRIVFITLLVHSVLCVKAKPLKNGLICIIHEKNKKTFVITLRTSFVNLTYCFETSLSNFLMPKVLFNNLVSFK